MNTGSSGKAIWEAS